MFRQKMLDKEIPFHQIQPRDLPLYTKAEAKEWDEWVKRESVRILNLEETREVMKSVEKDRIIGLRFVYRDKNASVRTPQVHLPILAKARLCAQAFDEPLAK